MKSAGKARNNGLYRHIRTSKEIIRNLLNDFLEQKSILFYPFFILCRKPGTENVTPTFFTLH